MPLGTGYCPSKRSVRRSFTPIYRMSFCVFTALLFLLVILCFSVQYRIKMKAYSNLKGINPKRYYSINADII